MLSEAGVSSKMTDVDGVRGFLNCLGPLLLRYRTNKISDAPCVFETNIEANDTYICIRLSKDVSNLQAQIINILI